MHISKYLGLGLVLNSGKSHDVRNYTPKWVPTGQHPWGSARIIDVRPITHTLISLTGNVVCAYNAMSWGQESGESFSGKLPDDTTTVPSDLTYPINGYLAEGVLYTPEQMEDKWAIFYIGGRFVVVHSWTRKVYLVSDVVLTHDSVRLTNIIGKLTNESSSFNSRLLDFLIRTHVLGEVAPVPVKEKYVNKIDEPNILEDISRWCFSMFGRNASFATPDNIILPPPQKKVCTNSLLHIAAVRGKTDDILRQLDLGVPIDIPDKQGIPPLFWCMSMGDIKKMKKIVQFLISKGANLDIQSPETVLMNAVKRNDVNVVKMFIELGADVNKTNVHGFTALHVAAELGFKDIVSLLLDLKADATIKGLSTHTPLSLAQMRNHTEIIEMLKIRS